MEPSRLGRVEASDQRPAQRAHDAPAAPDAPTFGIATLEVTEIETTAVEEGFAVEDTPVGEAAAAEFLPTMGDLDRLAADLDRVDLTLAQLDDPLQNPNG